LKWLERRAAGLAPDGAHHALHADH
jgi:hypothetical protein